MVSSTWEHHSKAAGSDDAAAVRELGEEIGVRGTGVPERWFRLDACEETGWEFCWIYRLRHDGPFVLHPDEIDAGEWLERAELARRMAARPQDYCSSFTLIWQRVGRESA